MTALRSVAKKWTTRGLRRALRGVIEELEIQRRHSHGRRLAAALHVANAQIQLGSGRNTKPGWLNVDLFAAGADLALDLREEFPFPDESATFVYSEHLLEHLEYPGDAHRFVSEVFRILKPDCAFSVVVPDAALALNAYFDPSNSLFEERRPKGYLVKVTPTRMHHVNYTFVPMGNTNTRTTKKRSARFFGMRGS